MSLRRRKIRRTSRLRRQDPPAKDRHIYASVDEFLATRLRDMRWPEPPSGSRERGLRKYRNWLNSQANRNRWRD